MPESSPDPDISILPVDLRDSAIGVGQEWCWRRDDAAKVIQVLAERGQVILGVEAWQLPEQGGPRVLDWSPYNAEDFFWGFDVVKESEILASKFIKDTPEVERQFFQLTWMSSAELQDFIIRKATPRSD